ncbi:MAG: class I SAM-dependent methyltransferase [Promethearchaeota archaeon]
MFKFYNLSKEFNLNRNDLVLEIGSGSNPLIRSDVLLDKYPIITREHRSSLKSVVMDDRPFIVGDACDLPFCNSSFDFVIVRHVLEHLKNPVEFINEIKRISKGVFISAPSPFTELVHGGFQNISYENLERKHVNQLHHGRGTLGHMWYVLGSENRIYLLAKSAEFYPMYLIFGYFIKNETKYKQSVFFNKNPEWRETKFISRDVNKIEVTIIKDLEDKTQESVDINELIKSLANFTYNTDFKIKFKSLIRKLLFPKANNLNIHDILACPFCKNKLIKNIF